MSIIDKVVAAVTPPESDEDRAKARVDATSASEPGDWLSLVLDHHIELEEALELVEQASSADAREAIFKEFAILLTGHAIAEESVLYPGLSANSQMGHADMGYSEQAMVKMQMAALERLDTMSEEFENKLAHVKGALLHHMYEEESTWFMDLKKKSSAKEQELLTSRYAEEFDRYVRETGSDDFDEEDAGDG